MRPDRHQPAGRDRTDARTALPGSIATASTLAFALVHKYVDGTPLYRLAQAFERAGVPVSRGALGHWVIGSSEMHLSRIYDALKLRLRSQPLIHGDETTVQVHTNDGRMPIDNNILERDIRIFATGRKSWLFSDTADGAKASAVVYSLMLDLSCLRRRATGLLALCSHRIAAARRQRRHL